MWRNITVLAKNKKKVTHFNGFSMMHSTDPNEMIFKQQITQMMNLTFFKYTFSCENSSKVVSVTSYICSVGLHILMSNRPS